MAWDNHATADRLTALAYLWEIMREAHYPLKPQEIRDYLLAVHYHFDLMHTPRFYDKRHNHGYFQSRAVFLSAMIFSSCQQATRWTKDSLTGMLDYLGYAFTLEGVHKEHSASYHSTMIPIYLEAQRMFDLFGVSNPLHSLMKVLPERMMAFEQHFTSARGVPVPFGDSVPQPNSPLLSIDPHPAEHNVIYPQSGYASFRNGWVPNKQMIHLFFTNSYFGRAHKQADNLGFHLSAFGEDWLIDGGNRNYNKDAFRAFVVSSFAHNTVVMDEMSVDTRHLPCKPGNCTATKVLHIPHGTGVTGIHRMYPGFRHTRTILYDNDKAFLIEDTVSPQHVGVFDGAKVSKKQHTFDILFHVSPNTRLYSKGDRIFLRKPGIPWELVLTHANGDVRPAQTDVIYGQTKPYLLGWSASADNQVKPLTTIRFRYSGATLPKTVTALYFRRTDSNTPYSLDEAAK
jgi:hypothetical protein